MDIREIAQKCLRDPKRNSDHEDLAVAVLEMLCILKTIAGVDQNTNEPLQAACAKLAGDMVGRWTDSTVLRFHGALTRRSSVN